MGLRQTVLHAAAARWFRRIVAVLALTSGLLIVTTTAALADDLTVTVTPEKASAGGTMLWVIGNAGDKPLRWVRVSAVLPDGMELDIRHGHAISTRPGQFRVARNLPAGATRTVEATLTGEPRTYPTNIVAVVRAYDRGVRHAAATTVELTPPPALATLTLSGGGTMTDHSAVELRARVTNTSTETLTVDLTTSAGRHVATLSGEAGADDGTGELTVNVPPGESKDVFVRAKAEHRPRAGKATVLVDAVAKVKGAPSGTVPTRLSASQDVDVQAAGTDLIPGVLGVSSAVLIPGLVGLWVWLEVRRRDRARMGLVTTPTAKVLWEDKLWLFVAAALSLVAVWVASAISPVDLLDAFTPIDLVVVSIIVGLLCLAVSAASVLVHRHRVPLVPRSSSEVEVLTAAAKADHHLTREMYMTSDKKQGLLVHTDGNALVLSPPVLYGRPDIGDALRKNDLTAALKTIEENLKDTAIQDADKFNGRFATGGAWVTEPTTVLDATHAGTAPFLSYDGTLL